MRPRTLIVLSVVVVACAHAPTRRAAPDREPERVPTPTTQPGPASAPAIASGPGMEALRRYTLECYEVGLKYNTVFAKGGSILIRWRADKRGDLLHLDFAVDTFRGWEIGAGGETLSDCVTRRAREEGGKVRYSPEGSAPLRLAPVK